jgi:aminoglycoside phosphotransferase (APT) family kinase protein
MMNSDGVIRDLAREKSWHLVQHINNGATADIYIIEKDARKYALKIPSGTLSNNYSLKTEYLVLLHLNQTPMKQYVPSIYEWVQDANGFLMEYLCYPDQGSKNEPDMVGVLALILKTLHRLEIPTTVDISDDRPDIINAISKRFRDTFQMVLKGHSFWATLPNEDMPKLEIVRRHYETYNNFLGTYETTTNDKKVALTHGDLAGDNIMLTEDGRVVLVDWGETRISSPLTDIAYLFTYSTWSPEDVNRFIQLYFGDTLVEVERALSTIQVLSKLYQYRSCIQSLIWLKEEGMEGLDTIGKDHFARMLETL